MNTTDIFERLAESLLHFVWQGGVLAVIVLMADRGLRGCSAQMRYAVHVAALLLMLACVPVTYALLKRQPSGEARVATLSAENKLAVPIATVTSSSDLPVEQNPIAAGDHPEVADASQPQSPPVMQTWDRATAIAHLAAPYAVAAYLLGVALMFGRLALSLMGGHRLCSEAHPITEPDLLLMVARQARRIGLRAAPVVAWCARTSVPLVAGLIKPMILLPVALASSLTPDQLEALLAHELAHLRRFDLLVNLLQRVAEALLFFHPAVWYVSRRISSERENCCDDSVLRAGWGRVEYADALVRMAEICAPLRGINGVNAAAILAAAGNSPSQFKRRIMRLLGEQESIRLGVSRGMAIAILGVVLAVLMVIPVLFSAPSLVAQAEKDSPPAQPAKSDEKSARPPAKQDKVVKVAPKPQEKLYFRGKEALERIESVKLTWSQRQNGVEFGIAQIGERDRFYIGERVPLEMFVRNVGEKSVKVQLAAEFLANVPEVINDKGEAVKVESVLALGGVALYRETLKPGEAFGFRHLGLGLGPNPTPKENWHPYWAEPTPGHYRLWFTPEIEIAPADESKPGERVKFTLSRSRVHFDIAPADEAKPPRDGVHRYVPNPKQKDVVIEQSYKDGQLHGPSRTFNRGELDQEENYKEGKRDGFTRSYSRGKIVGERSYKDGKLEGKSFSKGRYYSPKGQDLGDFQVERQYLHGKPDGTWTWELAGDRIQVQTYQNGVRHGLWERKSEDGKKVLFRLTYDQGNIVSEGETLKAMPFLKKAAAQAANGDSLSKRMVDLLQWDVDLEYFGTTAAEVVVDLGERFNMPMFVDIHATDVAGIGEKKMTSNDKQTPLFLALHDIASGHGLTFDYHFHALWLTTPKATAAWKDTTGVSDLKPAAGSALAKALSELPKFDLQSTPIAKLAEPLQKEYGLTLDASRAVDAKWTGLPQPSKTRRGEKALVLSFRDALSITLYMNNCRCREEGGKLIIEPVGVPPKEKAEPAKEKLGDSAKAPAAPESDPFVKPKAPNKVEPPPKPQDPKPRDGVHRIFDRSGKYLLMEQNYKDGQLHGPSLQFDSSGEVYVRQNYKEGKLDGFKRRYSDGKVVGETFYKDGKPEGVTFDTFPKFKRNGQYLNSKPEGTWNTENVGKWKMVKNYKDGLLDGPWERKSADGKTLFRLTYDKGNIVDQGEDLKALPFLQKLSGLARNGDPFAKRVMSNLVEAEVDLDYSETPAAEVVADLHERFSMPMYVDFHATDVAGIGETKIIVNEKSIPFFLGLREITAEHGLTFDYRFQALWLTTPKAAAAWKDTTGVGDLKPVAGSPLAKALPELPKFDLLATPIAKLPEPLQKEYGLTLDASREPNAKWTGPPQPRRPELRSLSFRDALSILLYQNHCHCREEGGKLIIEPLKEQPK